MEKVKEYKNIIIGFGFSCIPLLRELDRTNEPYIIITDKEPTPVWAALKSAGNIRFDLVSSYHTSYYSFDIVKDFRNDMYPLAADYYDMHLNYYKKYMPKIISDHVIKIDNYEGYSILTTESGDVYKTINLVISTGFSRKVLEGLTELDFSVSNQTFVFNGMGDSTNLMLAKLVAGNNKLIVRTNGFFPADKILVTDNGSLTLDQQEYHNFGLHFPHAYRGTISTTPFGIILRYLKQFQNTKIRGMMYRGLLKVARIFYPNFFDFVYPDSLRAIKMNFGRALNAVPFPNGIIIVKHWPIESYQKLFGQNLEESIKKGYLLNDIVYFVDQGMVELVVKDQSQIDLDNKQLIYKDQKIHFDHFVEVGVETPRIPPIFIHKKNQQTDPMTYQYVYRENLFGVIPKNLSNIFLLGLTRPTSGGLGNLTEMQGLFTHKLLSNSNFKSEIYSTIEQRLKEYNLTHYYTEEHSKFDHLVFYGFFTEDIARVLGINIRLRDCKTIDDFNKYFFFPNNTFKYRQKGEYKIDGCKELVEYIDKSHNRFLSFKLRIFSWFLYNFMVFQSFYMLLMEQKIGLLFFLVSMVLLYIFSNLFFAPAIYAQLDVSIKWFHCSRVLYLIAGVIAITICGPWICVPIIATDFLFTYILRQVNPEIVRTIFGDLKVKRLYRKFLSHYIQTYRSVYGIKNK